MDAKTFADELGKIEEEARKKVVDLVHRAQREEGQYWDSDEHLSFHDDPAWQYKADGLAELAGWIYDRVNGINRLHGKSVTKKIRKALGYTFP